VTSAGAAIQNYGAVFTRQWVVEVLLDLTGYTTDRDLGGLHLLEPSCGSGAFLGPAVERLIASAQGQGRDLASLADAVRAYDLQAEHVATCRALCRDRLIAAGQSASAASELAERWVRRADFLLAGLFSGTEDRLADVVVGNPPYIRYDDLAPDTAALYRRAWPTMRGRGDIYVGFIERSLRMLRPGGRIGFICADRWMRNAYGAGLRELVAQRYAVEHVWTMHDVDAFEAQVSAYPAITVLANHAQASVVVADTTAAFGASSAAELVKVVSAEGFTGFSGAGVTAHRLPHWFDGGELWPTGSPARLALIESLNDRFGPLDDPATGTRVSIGVASGADKVYVTKDPTVVESDRILPLAMRRDLTSGTFSWQGNYLVNPWGDDGSLVRLADYPRMAAYLSRHPVVRDRHVAKNAQEFWYRTIDKVHAKLTDRPKLLLQDMKAHIHPVLEPGGHYPHHNLYYVVSDTWDMEVLGGILLSRIAQAFIEAYCVRMRGGTLRFQAQYLKRIRVPRPDDIAPATQDALRTAFRNRDTEAATLAAADAYSIELKDYELARPDAGRPDAGRRLPVLDQPE
jgi:adenine-specific DNA-methyltransferase